MNIEIISIGDELLIGQTVNTNASWLGDEFSRRGATICRVSTISDRASDIYQTLDGALQRADVVIITGGLGPTKDDITKMVIVDYFQTELVFHQETLEKVRAFFHQRQLPFLDVNVQQAAVPKDCIVLPNSQGTAPGMWIEKNEKITICLPGVPYEMKDIVLKEVFPRIEQRWTRTSYYSKTANLQGIGESYVADAMQLWEDKIRNRGLELAYLPSPGIVRMRISSKQGVVDSTLIDEYFCELHQQFSNNLYGYGDETLAEVVGELLRKNKMTVGCAESCTAGALGAQLASVPGASAYFGGGLITYSNTLKQRLLNVQPYDLETHGAVSKQVVSAMAKEGRERLSVDYCIATSGIAGPSGASEQKPVGTTWIAIASAEKVVAKRFVFENDRQRNIRRTVLTALNLLRIELLSL